MLRYACLDRRDIEDSNSDHHVDVISQREFDLKIPSNHLCLFFETFDSDKKLPGLLLDLYSRFYFFENPFLERLHVVNAIVLLNEPKEVLPELLLEHLLCSIQLYAQLVSYRRLIHHAFVQN